jgi:hypothetical protein
MGLNKSVGGLAASRARRDTGTVKMEKRTDVAAEEFLIAVTSELTSQAPCFGTERQEGSDNVIVVERFQTKAPIKTGGAVHKDQGIFEATYRHAVTESDEEMNNV